MEFNSRDLHQIKSRGISPEKVNQQIEIFKRGNIVVNIREAATLKNGILAITEEEKDDLIDLYNKEKDNLNILKFIPASGAATRMFKALYEFLDNFDPDRQSIDSYIDQKNDEKLEIFLSRKKDLPFYDRVMEEIKKQQINFEDLPQDRQDLIFVQTMLDESGLDLGNQPKGLVPFHKYDSYLASAFEEHLWEAIDYAASGNLVRAHFTVAEEHQEKFEKEAEAVIPRVEKETGIRCEITYSRQDPRTDSIAVTKSNEPFRDESGELFFRPGGHGALIENLNNQDADLIFIKNIDNVVIPKYRQILSENKKMLAGKLLELQEKSFQSLLQLEKEISQNDLDEIIEFVQKELNTALNVDFQNISTEEKVSILKTKLHRPIRVCGMVRNEGEPGGGPFWVTHKNGDISLQIVESSQIDHENYQQSKIAQEATHFNPVDIVCSIRDHKGKRYNLQEFVDQDASFIANKTKDGKELKALELPGLWNGAMSDWITVFVEVPIETFNPVKTVADLLKPTHQVR